MRCIFFILFFLSGKLSLSCSCGEWPPNKLNYIHIQEYKWIFVGRISKVDRIEKDNHTYDQASFAPLKLYKGEVDESGFIKIRTSEDGSTCAVDFYEGDIYLIFSGGYLSKCSRFTKLNNDSLKTDPNYWKRFIFHSYECKKTEEVMKLPSEGLIDYTDVKGKIVKGKKDGRWDYFVDDSELHHPAWVGDTLPVPITSWFFRNGVLDSVITWGDRNQVENIKRYKNGEEYGWQESFYYTNKPQERAYIDENGICTRMYKYNGSGNLTFLSKVVNGYNYKYHYHFDGTLLKEEKEKIK